MPTYFVSGWSGLFREFPGVGRRKFTFISRIKIQTAKGSPNWQIRIIRRQYDDFIHQNHARSRVDIQWLLRAIAPLYCNCVRTVIRRRFASGRFAVVFNFLVLRKRLISRTRTERKSLPDRTVRAGRAMSGNDFLTNNMACAAINGTGKASTHH